MRGLNFGLLLTFLFLTACEKGSPGDAGVDTAAEQLEPTETEQPEIEETRQTAIIDDAIKSGVDYHSFANPDQVLVTHLDLDLTVNFRKKILKGTATLTYKRVQDDAKTLVLDTSALKISKVYDDSGELNYRLGEQKSVLGAPLEIDLPEQGRTLSIDYQTSPAASGLQWLTPKQTAGGKRPFLFSQAQATHARSFIPLQDSPQVRVTYNATLRTPKSLLAVMSAANDPQTPRDGVYEFTMPQAIPSYLIALAVGDLKFKAMGARTGVYAESYILDAAAEEFADTESMLEATEEIYGPYSWGRYDLLILPPSFPFGGMENPRLSFITPTVIAGDKSLVSLIAHELAHSWSGNSVSNASWRDLWLNEGFTTYLTYRIMEIVYGTDRYNMEAVLGFQDLQADLADLQAQDQILAIDLRNRDPDAVFSNIPYEKGALFLRELEHNVGRDNFDQFLRDYFKEFAFKSITTDEFLAYLEQTLLVQYPGKLNINRIRKWIFEPGLPVNITVPTSDAFVIVDGLRAAWLSGELTLDNIDISNWTVHEWLYFLNKLPDKLSDEQMQALDTAFSLTESRNNEIAHVWLRMSIKNNYQPAFDRLYDYLTSIGRNKLLKPLYRALAETAEGREFARKAFAKAKPKYHPLTVKANEGFLVEPEAASANE